MQYVYKKISLFLKYLYLNYIFNFYNMFIFFIKTIILTLILSSCSILLKEKKIFSNQLFNLKKHDQLINNSKDSTKSEKNKHINSSFFKNFMTCKNESSFISFLSNNTLFKKRIYIQKNSNFFRSARKKGLNSFDINTIIKAIEWQISFRKINPHSTFDLIFLREKINSKKNKNILLAIKLNNIGKTYYAIRAMNGNFYDINGFNKSNMIMNFALLKKYRISSSFNLHRIHPITHRISRHLGVDLAMPQGTLVLATSNGKIIKTGFNKISGFYIVLKNFNQCITKYMHLKKILVKTDQNIKINQKIALSGNSGRTTGPHLHYEIWMNKHAINPADARFSFIEPLTPKELILYFKTSKIILSKLK